MSNINKAAAGFDAWRQNVKMNVKMHTYNAGMFAGIQVVVFLALFFAFDLPGHKAFYLSAIIWLFYFEVMDGYKKIGDKQTRKEYIKGAKVVPALEIIRQIKESRIATYLRLGLALTDLSNEAKEIPGEYVPMPVDSESKHMLIMGTTGTGKTVCFSWILEQLIARGDKILIHDVKGDYLSRFYDPARDFILAPVDSRSAGYSLFNDIRNVTDYDAISASLIPPAMQQDPFWVNSARAEHSGILRYLYSQGTTRNRDIWKAVSAPLDEITEWLRTTPGAEMGYTAIQDPTKGQAMSVHSTMATYVKAYEYLKDGPFSINEWIDRPGGGIIFVSNYSAIKDTLKPIIALFFDLMARKLLSLPDDRSRRVIFLLDEFGQMQKLSSIVDLLTTARSKGGFVILGTQSIGQIQHIYGEHVQEDITNCCRSSVLFGVEDSKTAQWCSDRIDKAEVSDVSENLSMGPDGKVRDGSGISRQKKQEHAVMPANIKELPDRVAYLKLPGYDYTKVIFPIRQYTDNHPAILFRDDLLLKPAKPTH